MGTVSKIRRSNKPKGYIPVSTLTLFAFSSAFFPRVLTWFKFPEVINLLHLIIIPCVCLLVIATTKIKERANLVAARELFVALTVFFGITIASAYLNGAGFINAILNFLLLCEHFFMLLALILVPPNPDKFKRLQKFIIFASFANLFAAYAQYFLGYGDSNPDYIQGVFYESGAGHVVGSSVSMTFGVYYFIVATNRPLWLRASVAFATFWQMNVADAKQVLFVFIVAGGLLLFTKFNDTVEALKYLIGLVVLGGALYWAIYNVSAFGAFLTWARPEIYGPDGEATLLKTATFRIVPTFYDSFLDPLLGLGPGHTVGRLGGWMLDSYSDLLTPLGATIHPASLAVWSAVRASWLGDQSSMFSPLFGWAGIWGDLGLLGLGSFIYIWYVVWHRLCLDDLSKFLVLNVLVFGLIFSQMEEPGYMVYIAIIIGIRWQEYQAKAWRKKRELESSNIILQQKRAE
ncbi:hypothetical protein IQ238_00400 [Pleurocapsales cyanobacterium LEGE 06147]|nr:hypothetical protein [Pleurocapsales cyanobacterium LEGE 06147]